MQKMVEEQLHDWDLFLVDHWDSNDEFEIICADFAERIK